MIRLVGKENGWGGRMGGWEMSGVSCAGCAGREGRGMDRGVRKEWMGWKNGSSVKVSGVDRECF